MVDQVVGDIAVLCCDSVMDGRILVKPGNFITVP